MREYTEEEKEKEKALAEQIKEDAAYIFRGNYNESFLRTGVIRNNPGEFKLKNQRQRRKRRRRTPSLRFKQSKK